MIRKSCRLIACAHKHSACLTSHEGKQSFATFEAPSPGAPGQWTIALQRVFDIRMSVEVSVKWKKVAE
jgi:hypothetical protein